MTEEKPSLLGADILNTLLRAVWPVIKIKITDTLQQTDVPLGDTPYILRVSDVDLQNINLEFLEFISTKTKPQNGVILIPKKTIIKNQNPFLNWTAENVGGWISTMGPSDPWDNYEILIINSNISGINLTTLTLSDLETIGIPKNHGEIILDAHDKIAGFSNSASLDEQIDVDEMLKAMSDVINEYKYQFPMESWSISIVHEWVIQIVRFHENENWKKCLDIIYEHMIDGKTFKDVDRNTLTQYGMHKNYTAALVQLREEFLKRQIILDSNIIKKSEEIKEDIKTIMDKQDKTQEYKIDFEIGIFELTLRMHGPLQLQLKLTTNEGYVPDCSVTVTEIDFTARLEIQFDMARNVVHIVFLEKPQIKTIMDIKFAFGITIPLIGQESWLPNLAATLLEQRNDTNPIDVRIDDE